MKVGILCGVLIIVLDISVYLTPAECFTFIPISVSTGMAIIVALVKIKAIIVKVLLGLKAMGVDGFVWRRRRRRQAAPEMDFDFSSLPSTLFQEEFLTIWNDLQNTVGKVIDFDLESCVTGAKISSREKTNLPWDRVPLPDYLQADKDESQKRLSNDTAYSSWVSKTLGSITGDPVACQIVKELSSKSAAAGYQIPSSADPGNINVIASLISTNNKTNDRSRSNSSTAPIIFKVPVQNVKPFYRIVKSLAYSKS